MTLKTFLNNLKKTRSEMQWFLTRDGKIRAKFRSRYQSPLTAVAAVKVGGRRTLDLYEEAAEVLGLEFSDPELLSNVADTNTKNLRSTDERRLRRRLLNALDLSE